MELVHIKREEEELWTNKEEEQLTMKSKDNEKPESSQLRRIMTEDDRGAEPPTVSSAERMETHTEGEDGGGPEPDRIPDPAGLKAEWQQDNQPVNKQEENPHLWSSSLDWQDIVLVHIKREEEELWTSEEEEQLTVKSKDNEKPESSQLRRIMTDDDREAEPPTVSSAERTETKGEDGGGPEPDRNHDPNINLQTNADKMASDSAEAEVGGHGAVCSRKAVSVSGSADDDIDEDGRGTLTPKLRGESNLACKTAKKPFACPECCRTFPNKRLFQKHMTALSGEGPSSSSENKCSRKKQKADSEMRAENGEKLLTCVDCGRTFESPCQFKHHTRHHAGEKPFACDKCGKAFSLLVSLKGHMLNHTEEKLFQCGVCDKRFVTKGSLDQHMVFHREGKPFACSQCDKRFKCPADLQAHSRSHSGVKPFCCGYCGATFSRRESLNRHFRLHTGESPFACDKCGRKFTQTSHLKRHLLVHLKEDTSAKPRHFPCKACGKKFIQKSHLTVHMTVHTREKAFLCEICGVSFTRKDTRRRHKRRCHNE